jgi:hypothetical protein
MTSRGCATWPSWSPNPAASAMAWSLVQAVEGAHRGRRSGSMAPRPARSSNPPASATRAPTSPGPPALSTGSASQTSRRNSSGPGRSQLLRPQRPGAPRLLGHRARPRRAPPRDQDRARSDRRARPDPRRAPRAQRPDRRLLML